MTPHLHDSLRANSPGRSGSWREKKESLPLRLWNLNSTSNLPVAPRRLSCQIFANQLKAETSAIVNKHWKTLAKGNGVTTNVISANQHFASTYSFPGDVAASSPSFCRPAATAPRRACSQAIHMADERAAMKAEKVTLLGGFCYLNGHCINVSVNEFLKRWILP